MALRDEYYVAYEMVFSLAGHAARLMLIWSISPARLAGKIDTSSSISPMNLSSR